MPSSDVFKQYLRWLDIDYKKSKAVKIHYVVVHVHAIIQAFTIHVGKCCNLVPTHSCFELEGNKLLSSKEGLKSHKLSFFAANWTLSAPQNGCTNSRWELLCSVLLSTRMTLFFRCICFNTNWWIWINTVHFTFNMKRGGFSFMCLSSNIYSYMTDNFWSGRGSDGYSA